MLKAVIFDMDGVLIDSEPNHTRATMMALEKFNITFDIKYYSNFIGTPSSVMFENMVKDFNLDIPSTAILKAKNEFLEELFEKEGYIPLKGAKELISDLYEHGILLAVASSSSLKDIQKALRALGIESYFSKLVSGATLSNPKPAPDIFLLTAEELGVSPSECLIIEDSTNGVVAANRAGIRCVGYINPNSGKQNLSSAFILSDSFLNLSYRFIADKFQSIIHEP